MKMRVLMILLFALANAAAAQNTAEVKTAPNTAIPPMNVPAVTLPPGAANAPAGPAAAGPEGTPQQEPELEITAVELDNAGVGPLDDERLNPFKSILNKMAKGATYHIVSQESKAAPMQTETDWAVNGQYTAYVLPMERTSEGAIRLDARIEMNSGGKSLNALRAEGEVPPRKVMAFRGLDAGNGNELVLFLRQAPGDQQDQSGGDSGDSEQDQDMQQQNAQSQSSQQGDKDEQQPDDGEKDKSKEEPKPKDDDKTQMAKQEDKKDDGEKSAEPQDDQTIEAILKSLQEEDQRQQQEARFNRKQIILPPNGDWW